jgi:methyltransferase (TIGR00027 family)
LGETAVPQDVRISAGMSRTALFMTLIRDHESRRPAALFRDPFSEAVATVLAGTPDLDQITAALGATAGSLDETLDSPAFRYFAIRTRYFDDRLTAAMGNGIRQIVSLAAGLDGRPLRLPCPPGTRWYELDLPPMVKLKEALIAGTGIATTCRRRGVSADLTAGWEDALQAAGFDRGRPSAWLIEGLLMYLPGKVSDRLIRALTEASAPGSELLTEHAATRMVAQRTGVVLQDAVRAQNATIISVRDDIAAWVDGHGWLGAVNAGSDRAIGHGRAVPVMPAGWLAHAVLKDGHHADDVANR